MAAIKTGFDLGWTSHPLKARHLGDLLPVERHTSGIDVDLRNLGWTCIVDGCLGYKEHPPENIQEARGGCTGLGLEHVYSRDMNAFLDLEIFVAVEALLSDMLMECGGKDIGSLNGIRMRTYVSR